MVGHPPNRAHTSGTEEADVVHPVLPVSRAQVLDLAVRVAHRVPGEIVELGVAKGASTRVLRQSLRRLQRTQVVGPRKRIFAFDSFEGLPERFENLEPGAGACDPPRIRGVEIVRGTFEESLDSALAARIGRVALASLDADLYSSTLCALRWLTPLLAPGSLLLFDEYLGEGASEQRAHHAWRDETGVRTVRLAEFLREPSGGGSTPDRRVLFQVVGDGDLEQARTLRLLDAPRVAWRRQRSARRALWRRLPWTEELTADGCALDPGDRRETWSMASGGQPRGHEPREDDGSSPMADPTREATEALRAAAAAFARVAAAGEEVRRRLVRLAGPGATGRSGDRAPEHRGSPRRPPPRERRRGPAPSA